jgi:RimJ/RimL family protein N-acetyltransferase
MVRLERLDLCHAADLAVAAEQDRGSFGFTWVPRATEVEQYIHTQRARVATGKFALYAQVEQATGRAVGATGYLDPRLLPGTDQFYAVEVGFTWLAKSAQGTGLNTESKYLMFRHAFETWGVSRLDLKTDARNGRSRAAIARAGGQFEGVLRNWSRSWAPGEDGQLRDAAMFSLVASEWPDTRSMLEERLAHVRRTRQQDELRA